MALNEKKFSEIGAYVFEDSIYFTYIQPFVRSALVIFAFNNC